MDKVVREHLNELMIETLVDKDGLVCLENVNPLVIGRYESGVQEIEFGQPDGGVSYIVKPWRKYNSISGILLSKMQRVAGLKTPKVAPVILKKEGFKDYIGTIQKCLNSDGLVCVEDEFEAVYNAKIEGFYNVESAIEWEYVSTGGAYGYDKKWLALRNPRYREIFETVMTKECFDAKILSHIIREIAGDIDGGAWNYLTCRGDDGIVQAIVPIDLENSEIIYNTEAIINQEDFDAFVQNHRYDTVTPINQIDDRVPYSQRILEIRKLINEGLLTESQIKGLREAVGFDLAKAWDDVCKAKKFSKYAKGRDVVAMLQEYNRENLPELGL